MERQLNLNYDSPTEIKILLDMMGLGPRKRWGQNFLINPGARQRIVDLLEIQKGEVVWEVGPGLGAMTGSILEKGADLTAFEIDPGYIEYLTMAFADRGLKLVQGDVLKTWEKHWKEKGAPDKILGNLPYNAASAIIGDLLESDKIPARMVFLVQSEMGDRMKAKCGTKNYSSFSVLCQYRCKIYEKGKLNAGSFYPAPRVASKIVSMEPNDDSVPLKDFPQFLKLVRGLFSSRRKTIRNNLSRMASQGFLSGRFDILEKAFQQEGVDLGDRPEQLPVERFVSLCNNISDLVKAEN